MNLRRALLALAVAAGVLAGCEPAPSTPLAPDQPMPDTSKMSQEEINKLHNQPSGTDAGRAGGAPPLSTSAHSDNTPADRQGSPGG
ncbi:hypothetical protein [Fimbriimonas ginsengisoli]|uniref:Lipoprotein n=1 Tax=Fimbriimonas ginsengisoli Gsoil 348 TaxID=661478 RepID=A0A068NT47_FIMGI|nr:hypothetical protein [Fimbriimonas ginsengisoli]AIE86517.1 hypothetical protein OP10G_3149 [Fimbriimonas ginsengisoli Gsoil 348]